MAYLMPALDAAAPAGVPAYRPVWLLLSPLCAIHTILTFVHTVDVRLLAADRQRWALAFMAIASFYSVALGEKAYPFGLLIFLVTTVLTAWTFDWFVSALVLVASCLIVAYYEIPPIHSFRMEPRELLFFLGYTSAALVGSVLAGTGKTRAPVQVIPSGPASSTLATAECGRVFALTCDENGALLKVSREFLQFTGRNQHGIEGFRWLQTVHRSDRGYLGAILQKGTGVMRSRLRDARGSYRWFEILVEPRFWSVADQNSENEQFRKLLIVTATEDTDQS